MKNNYRAETDYLPINRWPEDERPREKLIKHGSQNLTNSELLAIMLRTGTGNDRSSRSALDLALKVNQNSRGSGHENSRPQDKKITPYRLLSI